MSHFTVLVIGNDVEGALEPYSQELSVDPYKVFMSKDTIRDMKNSFKLPRNAPLQKLVPHMDSWNGEEGGVEDGKLFSWSTYNTDATWDWFQIGGRWAGGITLKKEATSGQQGEMSWGMGDFKYEDTYDSAEIKDIPLDCLRNLHTFSVLTEDGEWISQGDMGWFGCSGKGEYSDMIPPPRLIRTNAIENLRLRVMGYREEYVDKLVKLIFKYYYIENCGREDSMYVLKTQKNKIKDDLMNHDMFRTWGWNEFFYEKFIKPLSPETRVTIVDCHI